MKIFGEFRQNCNLPEKHNFLTLFSEINLKTIVSFHEFQEMFAYVLQIVDFRATFKV